MMYTHIMYTLEESCEFPTVFGSLRSEKGCSLDRIGHLRVCPAASP